MADRNGDERARRQQLGTMLKQRRATLDPSFRSRKAFADATGLDYRLIYDIEEARRANFGVTTLTAIAIAYRLAPDAITNFLAGGELEAQPVTCDTAAAAESPAIVAAPRPALAGPPRRDVDFTAGIPEEELRPYTEGVLEEAYVALADLFAGELPGLDDPAVLETMLGLPGKAVFPENSNEQRVWDDPVYSPRERVDLIARFRLLRARMAREQRRRTGTGLKGHVPATGAITAPFSVAGETARASS